MSNSHSASDVQRNKMVSRLSISRLPTSDSIKRRPSSESRLLLPASIKTDLSGERTVLSETACHIAAGCLTGCIEYIVCQPVDMVATRRMLHTSTSSATSGLMGDIKAIFQDGGLRGLYRGLGPQLLSACPATCGMFAGERFFARIFENDDGSTDLPRTFAAGWGSGILESVLVCPFEVLKVRLQSTEYVGMYLNTWHCLLTMTRQEGFAALYSGAGAHSWRNSVFNSTFFSGCYLLRESFLSEAPEVGREGVVVKRESALQSFSFDMFCGSFIGAAATLVHMPFFVVKTRVQAMSHTSTKQYPKGTFKAMAGAYAVIVAEEGVAALFKGTAAATLRISLGSAISLPLFRFFSKAFSGGSEALF